MAVVGRVGRVGRPSFAHSQTSVANAILPRLPSPISEAEGPRLVFPKDTARIFEFVHGEMAPVARSFYYLTLCSMSSKRRLDGLGSTRSSSTRS